jgi:dihydroxyacid dehydratase/phosphogluconate dehydratase
MSRKKLRSDEWFNRVDEVGIRHRSALATLGVDSQYAAGRPIIGICNPISEFNNCEIGLQDLIEPIKRGVAQAGGLA